MKTSKQYSTGVLVTCTAMLTAWVGIGYMTISLYAASVCEEFGILRTQFMMMPSILALFSALGGMFIFGPMTKKIGYRKYLLICTLLNTSTYILMATAHSVWPLWIGGFLAGVGQAGINHTMLNTLIDQWYKKNQQTYISIPQTISTIVGVVVSVAWGGLIIKFGWRIPVWITVGISIAVTIICQIMYRGTPEEVGVKPMFADEAASETKTEGAVDGIPAKKMYQTKQFYLLAIGYFLFAVATWGVYNNMALFANDAGFAAASGIIVSIGLASQAIGYVVLAPIVNKFGSKWLIVVTMVGLSVASLLFMLGKVPFVVLAIAAFLTGISGSGCNMPFGASVREAFGSREFASKVGVIAGFSSLGAVFGPVLMSMFYDATGSYKIGQIMVVVLTVICIVCFFPGTKRVKSDN